MCEMQDDANWLCLPACLCVCVWCEIMVRQAV